MRAYVSRARLLSRCFWRKNRAGTQCSGSNVHQQHSSVLLRCSGCVDVHTEWQRLKLGLESFVNGVLDRNAHKVLASPGIRVRHFRLLRRSV